MPKTAYGISNSCSNRIITVTTNCIEVNYLNWEIHCFKYLLQPNEQAAAEKQLTIQPPTDVNAGKATQLRAAPIYIYKSEKNRKEKKKNLAVLAYSWLQWEDQILGKHRSQIAHN